jgi:hypothetical protein
MRKRINRIVVLTASLLFAAPPTAFGHGGGVITLSTKNLAAGGELVIKGTKFSKSAPFRVELRGALRTVTLGQVRTDTAGAFEMRVALPREATPGQYTVVAVATDGDVAGRAGLVVIPGSAPAAQTAGQPGAMGHDMGAMPGMPGGTAGEQHATADLMKVPVRTTAFEWAVIGALVFGSLAGGLALLRASKARTDVGAAIS